MQRKEEEIVGYMLEHLDQSDGKMSGMNKTIRPNHSYRTLGENAVGRGNQQERSKRIWIAAMLECEGTFTFQYNEQEKNGVLHSHIQPRVIFVNSDMKLVDAMEDSLAQLGFPPYRRDGIRGGLGKRNKSELQVNGFKSLPLLKMLRPFIVGTKAEVVDCLIQFIEYRQSLSQPKQKYGELEFELLRRVREINSGHWLNQPKFSSISSTTVRQRRDSLRAKIKSGLRGDTQSVAETTTPTGLVQ